MANESGRTRRARATGSRRAPGSSRPAVRRARTRPVETTGPQERISTRRSEQAEDLDVPEFLDEVVEPDSDDDEVSSRSLDLPKRPSNVAATAASLSSRSLSLSSRSLSLSKRGVGRLSSVNPKRAVGMLAVLVFLALTLAVPARTYLAQRAEFNRLQTANEQLQQEIDEYQRTITEQNDPAHIEAEARQRLQYAMPGERAVVLTYPAREKQEEADRAAEAYANNPWYANLWDAMSTPPPVGQ